jgi:hypothetical protein
MTNWPQAPPGRVTRCLLGDGLWDVFGRIELDTTALARREGTPFKTIRRIWAASVERTAANGRGLTAREAATVQDYAAHLTE